MSHWRSGRKMRLDLLPERATWGGYIYVLAFSDAKATVKVGSTLDPKARFSSHHGAGDPFGISIVEWCLSPEHGRHLETEKDLIRLAEQLGGLKSRREYFTGVAFADVVAQAQRIPLPERGAEAVRQAVETRRRTEQHEAEDRICLEVANRHTAHGYGITEAQLAPLLDAESGSAEVIETRDDLAEAIRMSRRGALHGRRAAA